MTKETDPSPFPWSYLALTFGFSWLIWLPAVLGHQGIIPFPADKYAEPLLFAGVFGPMFAASVLTYRAEGSQGLRRFLGRLVNVRFAAVWWIVIFALPLCVQAVAHFAPLLSGEAVQPSYISSVPLLPVIRPGSLDQHVYVYWAIALAVVAIIITALWGSASLTRTKGVEEAREVDVWDRCHS